MKRIPLLIAAIAAALSTLAGPAAAEPLPPPEAAPAVEYGWETIPFNTWVTRTESAGGCRFAVRITTGGRAEVLNVSSCSVLTGARVYVAVGSTTGLQPPAGCSVRTYQATGGPAGCVGDDTPLWVHSVYWHPSAAAYAVKVNACTVGTVRCEERLFTIFQ